MDTPLDHITLQQVIGVLTVVAAAWALVKKVIPGARRFFRVLDEIAGVPGDPERPGLMKKVDDVHHQVFANSGESLRDAVDKVAATQASQAEAIASIADANNAKAAALEQLAARLEQHITETAGTHTHDDPADPAGAGQTPTT